METKNSEYSANDLVELDDKMHYRKRPALVWGAETGSPVSPYSSMQRTALREIYENGVDEALQGHADRLSVKFFKDYSFEVTDNGRGIPVDINKKTGKNGVVQALGTLRSGRNFDSHDNKKSTGTNGLGASAVTIFSKRFDVTIFRAGKQYELSFKHGEPGFFDGDGPDSNFTKLEDLSYLKVSKDSRPAAEKKDWKTGTRIKVWFDNETFPTHYPYNDQEIIERLKGAAFIISNLKISIYNELNEIKDETTGTSFYQTEEYDFPDGLSEMADSFRPDGKLIDPIIIEGTGKYVSKNVPVVQANGTMKNEDVEREVPYEIALTYGDGYEFTNRSYVNTVSTGQGGVHLTAVQKAMTEAFNERFATLRGLLTKADELPNSDDFSEGLTLIVSIYMSEPSFTSQSKEALSGRDVQKAIADSVRKDFALWIADKKNGPALDLIARKVTTAAKNRQKAREQRDLNRKKNEISQSSLPVKLLDCEVSGTEDAELYICEGDSAVSGLKAARDGRINALLGIRGKIINAHKENARRVLDNAEVRDIIKTLGAGAGKEFNSDQVRYGRVFIATDADPDGNNIACLLYALFWHQFKPLIEEGRLYKLETPLFVISVSERGKSRKIYARDEKERDKNVKILEKSNTKFSVTRLKGLGEVKPTDLYNFAIDPETRVVTQITMEDLDKTLESLDLILGNDTAPRKRWIEESDIDEELLGE